MQGRTMFCSINIYEKIYNVWVFFSVYFYFHRIFKLIFNIVKLNDIRRGKLFQKYFERKMLYKNSNAERGMKSMKTLFDTNVARIYFHLFELQSKVKFDLRFSFR